MRGLDEGVVSGRGEEITRYSQEQTRHFRLVGPLTLMGVSGGRRRRRRVWARNGWKVVKATKCEINYELLVLGSAGKTGDVAEMAGSHFGSQIKF